MPKHETPEFREMDCLLRSNGYRMIRTNGSHFTYAKKGCHRIITLPKDVNVMIMKRLVKQINGGWV